MPSIISIDDVADDAVDRLLARAAALRAGARPAPADRNRLLALAFFEPSLRTRLGFAAAAARLGWQSATVFEPRGSAVPSLESWSDTLRTIAAYSDAVVARPARPLSAADRMDAGSCPLINGGDRGPLAEHPSQALIDLFAIEQLVGPVGSLGIAIVGDPRMRAVRSLMALLARRPPAALALVADPEHLQGAQLPPRRAGAVRLASWETLGEVDLVYVAGIPHQSLPLDRRDALLATARRVEKLPRHCVLMSPMPVIDEMDAAVRVSDRNRMFEQSRLGLYVRMALLEHVTHAPAPA